VGCTGWQASPRQRQLDLDGEHAQSLTLRRVHAPDHGEQVLAAPAGVTAHRAGVLAIEHFSNDGCSVTR
jgi:hypothetical protein